MPYAELGEKKALLPPNYLLTCRDGALDAQLRAWLDASRLAWPGTLRLDVEVVASITANDDPRELFPQADLQIQAGPPDGTVRIRWDGTLAEAVVDAVEPVARLRFTPAAIDRFEEAERAFLLVTLLFMLRRVGWYHVHCAAMIDPRGRGWVFVGQSGSGKSTTTALLAGEGWSISTDDIAFLSDDGITVGMEGFWSPIALRPGGRELLGASGGADLARRGKEGFRPEELGGAWIPRVTPSIVVFTSIGDMTGLVTVAPRVAINRLIESSLWVLFETVHAQEHLDLLARLVTQSRAFQATLGPDLFTRPNLLQDLVP